MTEPASVNAAPVENGVATSSEEQPGTKVFAGNLAYTTTDEGLKTFFSPVADDIVSAQVILRGSRSAGYGFVAFKTAEAAQKAVDLLNKKELDGRTLIVEVAKPTDEKREKKQKQRVPKKRVSKKPKASNGDASATDATENKESGAATDTGDGKPKKKRNTRKTKKPKVAGKEGEAPAVNGDNAAAAPASEPKPKKPKAPRPPREPRERKPARPVGETPAGEPSKSMLFVANLGFNVDDAQLSELFTGAGITVVSARVVRRRWGGRRSKGYGFVDVGSEEEQKKALELLQGKDVGGREIAVKIAVNAQEKEDEAESGAVPSMIPA